MIGINIEHIKERNIQIIEALKEEFKSKERPLSPKEQIEKTGSAVFYKYEDKGKWK